MVMLQSRSAAGVTLQSIFTPLSQHLLALTLNARGSVDYLLVSFVIYSLTLNVIL